MKSTIKTLLLILILAFSVSTTHAKPDDFEIVKERVVAEVMKSSIDDGRVEEIMNKMNEDGSFQGINYNDLSRTAGFPQRISYL